MNLAMLFVLFNDHLTNKKQRFDGFLCSVTFLLPKSASLQAITGNKLKTYSTFAKEHFCILDH